MNYQHIYHAGNFTDVFKHCLLICLIDILTQKEKPIFYLDTHSGQAIYDLTSPEAKISHEYENGINKLFGYDLKTIPKIVSQYLSTVLNHNPKNNKSPVYYPGSILVAHEALRKTDRIVGVEFQQTIYQALKNFTKPYANIGIHLGDAYEKLLALIPPKENRGLVLIDPAYEEIDELSKITNTLNKALKKWRNGTYALWYPIKKMHEHKHLIRSIKASSNNHPCLQIELSIFSPATTMKVNGCGIIIINPPWKTKEAVQTFLPWLWKELSVNQEGNYLINMMP